MSIPGGAGEWDRSRPTFRANAPAYAHPVPGVADAQTQWCNFSNNLLEDA